MRIKIGNLELVPESPEDLDMILQRFGALPAAPVAEKMKEQAATPVGVTVLGWYAYPAGISEVRRFGCAIDERGFNFARYTATARCVRDEADGSEIVRLFMADDQGKDLGPWVYDQAAIQNFQQERQDKARLEPGGGDLRITITEHD